MKRLAYFIPFQGCTRRCVYCDQRTITADAGGSSASVIAPERIERDLAEQDGPVELCFFGGSFARLKKDDFIRYLDCIRAAPEGSRITFSSYPGDFEEAAIIEALHRYPIGTIELGVPSLDPAVLRACGREDAPEKALGAISRLREAGFHIGLQIMTGLPMQSDESVRSDVERLAALMSPGDRWDMRIYPCLVLKGTELERMYSAGVYVSPTLEVSVRLAGALMLLAEGLRFDVIRVGLLESEALRQSVVAGPYHPAFGELALSEKTALELVQKKPNGPWDIEARKLSRLTGHGRRGIERLAELAGMPPADVESQITVLSGPYG